MHLSEILAQIEHKCPNWTILTLKMTFRVISHLSYFGTGWVSHQSIYMLQYIWAMSIIMGKWAKPDLYDLTNNSIKSAVDHYNPQEAAYKT